jgi:hypothetical protein
VLRSGWQLEHECAVRLRGVEPRQIAVDGEMCGRQVAGFAASTSLLLRQRYDVKCSTMLFLSEFLLTLTPFRGRRQMYSF